MKSKIIGKKQLLTLSLVSALGLAVFVNWYYTKPQGEFTVPETSSEVNLGDAQYVGSDNVTTEDFFENAEIERKKARDLAKENLNNIINDNDADSETKAIAREKLAKISEQIKAENDIETLISAQIKNSCIVTYNGETIEVILPEKSVNEKIILKIKDIILSKTSVTADKITIIETK